MGRRREGRRDGTIFLPDLLVPLSQSSRGRKESGAAGTDNHHSRAMQSECCFPSLSFAQLGHNPNRVMLSPRSASSSTYCHYEGDPTDKFTQALALLLHQIYSSNWANLEALHIPFKWGYDTLISNNG